MERDYTKLPFISISRENLKAVIDYLEIEQIGNLFSALAEYILYGTEPSLTKVEQATFNQIMAVIKRTSEPWFLKKEGGKKGAEKRWNKDKDTDEPQEPEKSTYTEPVEDTEEMLVEPTATADTLQVPYMTDKVKVVTENKDIIDKLKKKSRYYAKYKGAYADELEEITQNVKKQFNLTTEEGYMLVDYINYINNMESLAF